MISVILTYLHILSFVFLTNPLTLIGRGSSAVISALNEARETLQRLKKSMLKADETAEMVSRQSAIICSLAAGGA